MIEKTYDVSKKNAAYMLGVSLKKLYRIAKKNGISPQKRGKTVYFQESDVALLKEALNNPENEIVRQTISSPSAKTAKNQNAQDDFIEIKEARIKEHVPADSVDVDLQFSKIKNELLKKSPEEVIYKSLYEKKETELKTLLERLDLANYRVGQMEAQIKSMIPLIEFKKKEKEILALSQSNTANQKKITNLEQQVRLECFVKKIYAAFLYFIVAITPLLIILRLLSD